jgi:hypothetical protein
MSQSSNRRALSDDDEERKRQMRYIKWLLSKLTLDNFERVADQILEVRAIS